MAAGSKASAGSAALPTTASKRTSAPFEKICDPTGGDEHPGATRLPDRAGVAGRDVDGVDTVELAPGQVVGGVRG